MICWLNGKTEQEASINHLHVVITCSVLKLLPTEDVFRLRHVHPYFMWFSVQYSLFIYKYQTKQHCWIHLSYCLLNKCYAFPWANNPPKQLYTANKPFWEITAGSAHLAWLATVSVIFQQLYFESLLLFTLHHVMLQYSITQLPNLMNGCFCTSDAKYVCTNLGKFVFVCPVMGQTQLPVWSFCSEGRVCFVLQTHNSSVPVWAYFFSTSS